MKLKNTYSRHTAFLVWALLGVGTLYAQNPKLSEEPGTFITEVKKLMEGSKNPLYVKTAQELDSIWMSVPSAAQQAQFVTIARRTADKVQKPAPLLNLLMRNFRTLLTQPEADVNGFLATLDRASELYDAKVLQKVLESMQLLVERHQLYSSNFNKLYVLAGSYRFRFDDSQPDKDAPGAAAPANDGWDTPSDTAALVKVLSEPLPVLTGALVDLKEATFAMVSGGDSAVFGPSTGAVSLRAGTFVGQGGKFDWTLAGTPSIYVDFGEYSFNAVNPKLTVENVTLHDDARLEKPVRGVFEFKPTRRPAGKPSTYPRFVSQQNDVVLRNSSKHMTYKGGFSLVGTTVYSTSLTNEPAQLYVTYQDKPAFRMASRRFIMTDTTVAAQVAELSLPLGRDSIYHPGVRFRYSDQQGILRLERADNTPYASLPYVDSYHKMNIWAEAMRWDFPKEQVEFYMIVGKKELPVRLESFDYFRKQRFAGIAEEIGFQPLVMAANYVQTQKVQAFSAYDLATKYRQNPTIMRNALERLSLDGYFDSDPAADQYRLSRKGIMYILANVDKSDYDNFQIISQFQSNSELANATISLKDTLMTVRGVERFVVSDSLKIVAVPSDKKVVIGRGRDFTVNGQLKSANFRFAGSGLKFDYDQFFVSLDKADSITYTPQEKYAKGMSNEVGGHVKYEKGGTFFLSDPKNKSGRQKGGKSPRIVVPDGLTVYFDQPERKNLKYNREVFFKIPKLDFDSLDKRDMVFVGTFTSDGILPPIKTTLKSMDDNSLGFEYKSTAPLKLYGGTSALKTTEPMVMDNNGLRAVGVLTHLAATIPAREMLLTTDSLIASGSEATIKEATIGKGYFPKVELKNYSLRWFPKVDSMFIVTQGNSFNFYAGTTQLEGGLLVRSAGLFGQGALKRKDSELLSQDIKFNKEGFVAKKAEFSLNGGQEKSSRPILLGKNIDVEFNVAKNFADLSTTGSGFGADTSALEFPYAAYRTSINKARWNIANKTIAMKGDVENSTFTATAADQEGLAFNGSAALYEIDKMTLNVSGVPYIRTADVKIIPDKGVVSVRKNGEMAAFKNARILIDTLNSSHRMKNADIRIVSRNRFEGSATYQYVTSRKDTFNIKMENFELREAGSVLAADAGKKNRKSTASPTPPEMLYTTARAQVRDEDKFMVAPRIQYKGIAVLIAYEPLLQLDGQVRPMLKPRPDLSSSWINMKESSADSTGAITIKVNKELKNEVEQSLFAGLHYRSGGGMYMSFLSPKFTERDQDIFSAQGSLSYDEDDKVFRIMPPPGPDGLINEANAFVFDDQKGTASFAGPLKISSSELIRASGLADIQVDSARYDFNTMLLVNVPVLSAITPDLAAKIVQTNLDEQNSDPAEDDADRLNTKLAALIGQKAADEFATKTAAGYKPLYEASPDLGAPMVLSNVNLRWSDTHGAYFSMGKIGMSNLGRSDINAQMEGVLEIRRTDAGDEFGLYLELSPDVWYYLDYAQSQLGIVSSDVNFNDQILAKSKNAKAKGMELVALGFEEKAMFLDRFSDFYQPALKKAMLAKAAAAKKEAKKKVEKKKAEAAEGF